MRVAVIFDPNFSDEAPSAVWILDTPANRLWFEQHTNLDPNSAIFSMERYPSLEDAGLHMIWNAQEHHPSWSEIEVVGLRLMPLLCKELAPDGEAIPTEQGFRLLKR